jgi:hypothetical protein
MGKNDLMVRSDSTLGVESFIVVQQECLKQARAA